VPHRCAVGRHGSPATDPRSEQPREVPLAHAAASREVLDGQVRVQVLEHPQFEVTEAIVALLGLEMAAELFPDVELRRGLRFVDNGRIATAGGLTSGIDMALHVVARYYGTEVAATTARYMEYASDAWRTGASGAQEASRAAAT
jgi:hypothetical protein